MTALQPQSPVKRETSAVVRGRAIVVILHPGWMEVKEKGRKHTVSVSYRAVMDLGYKLLAREQAAERKAKKCKN